MKTTADYAKQVRSDLKSELGLTSRDVSVKSDVYSLGSTIRVTVKRTGVDMAAIKRIAMRQERVARCEQTGDVLCGGNTHVTVDFDRSALASAIDAIQDSLQTCEENPGVVKDVDGWRVWARSGDWVASHSSGASIHTPFRCSLARQMATHNAGSVAA